MKAVCHHHYKIRTTIPDKSVWDSETVAFPVNVTAGSPFLITF